MEIISEEDQRQIVFVFKSHFKNTPVRVDQAIETSSVFHDTQVHNNPRGSQCSEPGNRADREAV